MKRMDIGGVRLNVLDLGEGKPLLLVHGFPLDHTMWMGQVEYFADECRVIAPDLRGFGRSEVTDGEVTMDLLADDLARLLDTLGVDRPAAFCGLSMGGYIAWRFWRRHSERIDRLILCDTRAAADSEETVRGRLEMADRVLADGASSVADAMAAKLFAESTRRRQPELVEGVWQVMSATAPAAVAAALRGMAKREDATPLLREIQVPTLVLCGQQDAIVPVEEMRAIADALPAGRLVEIPEAGHLAPLENPGPANAAIHEHLRG